jgi:hypothetical protein
MRVSASAEQYAETPFDTLRNAFAVLLAEPCPLALSADEVGDVLPSIRELPLPQIKALLLNRSTRPRIKRGLWAAIVRRAQNGEPAWTLAAAGLTYPLLAGRVLRVCRASEGDIAEFQAEVLVELLAALKSVDVDDPAIGDFAGWLAWRAVNTSKSFRAREARAAGHVKGLAPASAPLLPTGHPDLVLAHAVRAGVIDRAEADWISRTCLDQESAKAVAREYGMGLSTFYERRHKAGRKIAAAIESGDLHLS